MNKTIKAALRRIHNWVDAAVGALLQPSSRLYLLTARNSTLPPLTPQNFAEFSVSRRSHFKRFLCLPVYQKKFAYLSDLKVYQDLLVYTFIIQNLPPGARLLEIGGGNSRIIAALKSRYEFWNLDKLEGKGYGPTTLEDTQGYRLVRDYIGVFNSGLPNGYFDCVYSISTLEHLLPQEVAYANVLKDINRLLKPGGWSIHCIDQLLGETGFLRSNGIIDYFYAHQGLVTPLIPVRDILNDRDLYTLSAYQYYTRWLFAARNLSYKRFGHPLSYNLLWVKPA
jgi:SAM-dependent methyltransferase